MELQTRRTVARFVRFGLVALALVIAASWMMRRMPGGGRVGVETTVPTVDALGAGDLQIFSEDSTLDVILRGSQILAGLSPQTVAKVQEKIAQSTDKETTGVGGAIAQMVKKTVADKIGTHVSYDLADIREIRYDDGRIVLEWKRGGEQRLLGKLNVENDKDSDRFRREDAERFIAAVKARL